MRKKNPGLSLRGVKLSSIVCSSENMRIVLVYSKKQQSGLLNTHTHALCTIYGNAFAKSPTTLLTSHPLYNAVAFETLSQIIFSS